MIVTVGVSRNAAGHMEGMTAFDETTHARDRAGKFTEMAGSAPDGALTAPADADHDATPFDPSPFDPSRPRTAQEQFERTVRELAATDAVHPEAFERAVSLGQSAGYTRSATSVRIAGIRNGTVDLYEDLPYGPSTVTRGQAVGYSVSETRMTREFVEPEDRAQAARVLAERSMPGRSSADPAYWMDQFEVYDAIDEYEVPAGATEHVVAGARSVSRKALNLDLDHQPLRYSIGVLRRNEDLARADGPYRHSGNPEREQALTEAWDARADRLRDVRERMEQIAERASERSAQVEGRTLDSRDALL
jgi:hypothetical protein